jgi:hypothetical protein
MRDGQPWGTPPSAREGSRAGNRRTGRSSLAPTPPDRRRRDRRPPPPGSCQGAIRLTGGIALLLTAVVSVVVLGACLSSLVVGFVRQVAVTSAPEASPSPSIVRKATPTPTATSAPSLSTPDWRIVRESEFGFRLDIPGALGSPHGFFINGTSGQGFDLSYYGAPLADALQRLETETHMEVLFSTAITDQNICPSSGTLVTVGPGISGRQQTDVPPTPTGPSQPYPYVMVSLVFHGVAIRLQLSAPQADPQTFLTRYGGLWQHVLASVSAVPGGPGDTNHPCG